MAKRAQGGGSGPSHRQLKVGETIRRALADALLRGETHDPELARHSITVSEVRASPDLKHATAYVLPLGGRDAEAAIAALRANATALRRLIGRQLTLKYTPELRFVLDDSFDRADATEALFRRDAVRRDLDQEERGQE